MDTNTRTRPAGPALSRRKLVGLLGLGGAGLVVGDVGTASPAAAHGSLLSANEIWNVPTFYDSTGARSTNQYNPTFYGLLEEWMASVYYNTPWNWNHPMELWDVGVHVDKAGSCAGMSGSCHSYGRAIDLRRLYMTVDGVKTQLFNGRYDQWSTWADGPAKDRTRRWYWATIASLNYYFTYVLHHYDSNSVHKNHVHVDNSVSGSGYGKFSTGRRSQVYSTQANLRYLYGYPTSVDGSYGPQTDGHSREVLARLGYSGGLTDQGGTTNWRMFNHHAFRFGVGTQSW